METERMTPASLTVAAGPQMINVLVVDRSEVFARGIGTLGADITVAGSTVDVDESVDLVRALCPEVLLLDTYLTGRDPTVVDTVAVSSSVRVILVSSSINASLVRNALAWGVSGHLRRDIPAPLLASHIREVAAGGRAFDDAITAVLLEGLRTSDGELSDIELEALRLVAHGHRLSGLCHEMALSESTAKRVLRKALSKLGANSHAQGVALAVRQGLI